MIDAYDLKFETFQLEGKAQAYTLIANACHFIFSSKTLKFLGQEGSSTHFPTSVKSGCVVPSRSSIVTTSDDTK